MIRMTKKTHGEEVKELYEQIKDRLIKIPVKDRTEKDHQFLISYYDGVREYLLTMGEFKDIELK